MKLGNLETLLLPTLASLDSALGGEDLVPFRAARKCPHALQPILVRSRDGQPCINGYREDGEGVSGGRVADVSLVFCLAIGAGREMGLALLTGKLVAKHLLSLLITSPVGGLSFCGW